MVRFINTPFVLFTLCGVIYLIASFFLSGKNVDLLLRNTFYAFDLSDFLRALALCLLLFGFFYKVSRRFLYSPSLTWIHMIVTLIVALLLPLCFLQAYKMTQSGAPTSLDDIAGHFKWQRRIVLLMVILLMAQLLLITNLLLGWARKKVI